MPYKKGLYTSKNVYLPNKLCERAEKRAAEQYMNFTVYIRKLILDDLNNAQK